MQTQTLNISLPSELVKMVDKVSAAEYGTRSDFIRTAIMDKIRKIEQWEEIYAIGKKMGSRMSITNEQQVNEIVYNFRHGKKSRS